MNKTPLIIIITLILLALVIFLGIKLLSTNENYSPNDSEAISVIDGDTLETSESEIIRLLCVDTPEINQDGYEEAKNYLSSLILGEDITIERTGVDSYNRTLAWIYSGDILVNKEIVDNGYGELFEYNGTDCERMK